MKKPLASSLRAFPIAACVLSLGFAAACGDRSNSAVIRSNTGTTDPSQTLAQKVFKGFDSAKTENQNLIGRVIGATATVKPTDNAADSTKKWFTAKTSFLVIDEATQAATQVVAEGMIYAGQADDAKSMVDDGQGKSHREIHIKIKEDESSDGVKGQYSVEAACGNDDCSQLAVQLRELIASSETEETKKSFRHYVIVFQRKAGAAIDDALTLGYAPGSIDTSATDQTAGSGKVRRGKATPVKLSSLPGFEDAKKNFKGTISPAAKDLAVAPTAAPGSATAPAATAAPVGAGAADHPAAAPASPTASAPVAVDPAQLPAASASPMTNPTAAPETQTTPAAEMQPSASPAPQGTAS